MLIFSITGLLERNVGHMLSSVDTSLPPELRLRESNRRPVTGLTPITITIGLGHALRHSPPAALSGLHGLERSAETVRDSSTRMAV